MMQGIDNAIDVVIFTGYHARAGTVGAPLAHTWNGWVHDVRINGKSTGEYGINAAIAGDFDAGVVMVAGDDQAVQQTQEYLGSHVVGAIVKWGVSTSSAMHMHPATALDLIRDAARQALTTSAPRPLKLEHGTQIEVDADHQARIDQALLIPGVKRAGNRSITFTVNSGVELNDMFRLVAKVGGLALNH